MNLIYRGSTPTHAFSIPVTEAELKAVRVTYRQSDGFTIEKAKGDCTFEEGWLYTQLTQDETLKLDPALPVRVQLNLLLTDGRRAPSQIITCCVGDNLHEEAMA